MQHLKALGIISLLLIFALVTFGCATSRNQIENAEFGLSATEVPEGILLTFSNLPSDATHLWIGIASWEGTEEQTSDNYLYHYAAITVPSVEGWVHSTEQLDIIKQTGRVIFPVAQSGLKYNIVATAYNEQQFNSIGEHHGVVPNTRSANSQILIENDGISFNRDVVKLDVNDTYSSVTLSSEPNFTTDVIFDDQKYTYSVGLNLGDGRSISMGDHHFPDGLSSDGLTWVFEPHFRTVLDSDVAREWLVNETYPARANVYANIIFNDINWCIEIARSPEFTYSL